MVVMTAKCLGSLAAKQAQIISPLPPCLTVGCADLPIVVFTIHYALCLKTFTLVSSVQRTLFQMSCSLFRCNFANINDACSVFF